VIWPLAHRVPTTTMFWDNDKDSAWTQRLKNGVFLKLWAKNETRDAVLPWIALVTLSMLGVGLLIRLLIS
jgi:hypothetical protein